MSPAHVIPAALLFLAAFVIAMHHFYIHSIKEEDRAREESCPECCYLQPSDMANHEIWVISLATAGFTWLLAGAVLC